MSREWYSNSDYDVDDTADWYLDWICDVEIICPYCNKRYEPIRNETHIGGKDVDCYKEGELGTFMCDVCGKRFKLSAQMKWEYTTKTIDGEMTEEEHDNM